MNSQFISSLIVLSSLVALSYSACLSSQVYEPVAATCASQCLPYYYIVDDTLNKVCVPQDPVKNILRETPNPFEFIIIFDQIDRAIFNNVAHALQYLSFSWDLDSGPSPILPVDLTLNFLDTDNTVLEVEIAHKQGMTSPAIFNVDFKNNALDTDSSFYFITSRLSIGLIPFTEYSSRQENLINVLARIDSYAEIGWTAATILNCYPVLYMYGKFYRETFNLYKMTGISYSPLAQEFFRREDNKIAGIKVPNVPAILLYEKVLNSGWDNLERSRILLQDNPTRDDYKILLSPKFQEWNTSPLFLENFGIEITVILGSIAIMIIVEILAFFIFNDEASETTFYTLFNALRVFLKWNFLMATILGSFPSFIYYAVAQIKAFAEYGTLGHNLGSSIAAIVLLVVFGVVLPIFLFRKIRQTNGYKERDAESIHFSEVLTLEFYGLLHEYYKSDRIIYPMFTFLPIIRGIVTSLIIFFFPTNPLIQVSVIMALSFSSFSLLTRYRPYSKSRYNIMHLGFEFLNLCGLTIMEIIAANQSQPTFSNNVIEILNLVLVCIWVALPFWPLFLGLFIFVTKLIRLYRKEKPLSTFTQRKSVFYTSKVTPIQIPQRTLTSRREGFERQKTVDTLVLDNGATTKCEISSPSSSRPLDEEDGQFMLASRKRLQNIMKPKNT